MLIKDEALQARHATAHHHTTYSDAVNQATMTELGRARVMERGNLAPNNPAAQMGDVMTPHEFETKIVAKLGVPNLVFEVHPTNRNKRCMYQVRGNERALICVYENNPMPEFSIIYAVEKWVPDLSYLGETGDGKVVQRKDLAGDSTPVTAVEADTLVRKHGFAGALAELLKRDQDREPGHAGMKKIRVPGAEAVRGWRTVLTYMMQHGLVSPEQIRNVVQDADRASWAGYMGRTEALGEWLR